MTSAHMRPETLAVHAGREDLTELGVHALPIDLSTTNPLPNIELGGDSYEELATGGLPIEGGSHVYARLWNPTVARFEKALALLEHADEAVAFSSGMAALTAATLAFTWQQQKSHVIAVRPLYGGTDYVLGTGLLGVDTTFCAADEVAESIRDTTGLIVIETPANPTLDLINIERIAQQAAEVPILVDNTFATPLLQNPLQHGADMALHSATKYLGGHGDVIAGAIAATSEAATQLRKVRAVTGGILHPLGAYLLHRGLQTLPLRVKQQQENAQAVAAWLSEQPEISEVFYPGSHGDPEGLIGTQLHGTGSMLSIRMRDGYDAAASLTSRVHVFTHAVSLGGVDSLIQHPAALTHRPVPPEARPGADIVRISVGLEHPDDLIEDLTQALRP